MIIDEKNPPKSDPQTKQQSRPTNIDLEKADDDSVLNRIIQVRSMPQSKAPKGQLGILYYDSTNKKLKIYVGGEAKWADIVITTTSTSTTTTSSSTTTT